MIPHTRKLVPVSKITADPDNPNVMTDKQMEAMQNSIESYGNAQDLWLRPDGNGGYIIIDGEHRYQTVKDMGHKKVSARVFSAGPEEARIMRQVANKLHGRHDPKRDAEEIKRIHEAGMIEILAEQTAIDVDALRTIIGEAEPYEPQQPEEPPKRVKEGQTWQLGTHRLVCAESPVQLDAKSIDLIMTSPPYAEMRKKQYGGIPVSKYPAWWVGICDGFKPALKDTASIILNIKEGSDGPRRQTYVMETVQAMIKSGYLWVEDYIWTKSGAPGNISHRLRNAWEHCFQFTLSEKYDYDPKRVQHATAQSPQTSKKSVTRTARSSGSGHNTRQSAFGDLASPSNVLNIQGSQESLHPAAFPEPLPAFFIRLFTEPHGTILDPFAGSGTTLIACENNDRTCIAIERKPEYCDIILHRWEKLTGQKAVKS